MDLITMVYNQNFSKKNNHPKNKKIDYTTLLSYFRPHIEMRGRREMVDVVGCSQKYLFSAYLATPFSSSPHLNEKKDPLFKRQRKTSSTIFFPNKNNAEVKNEQPTKNKTSKNLDSIKLQRKKINEKTTIKEELKETMKIRKRNENESDKNKKNRMRKEEFENNKNEKRRDKREKYLNKQFLGRKASQEECNRTSDPTHRLDLEDVYCGPNRKEYEDLRVPVNIGRGVFSK